MRPPTDGWHDAQRRGLMWTIILSLATLAFLVVITWPEWVSLARCLWRKECY